MPTLPPDHRPLSWRWSPTGRVFLFYPFRGLSYSSLTGLPGLLVGEIRSRTRGRLKGYGNLASRRRSGRIGERPSHKGTRLTRATRAKRPYLGLCVNVLKNLKMGKKQAKRKGLEFIGEFGLPKLKSLEKYSLAKNLNATHYLHHQQLNISNIDLSKAYSLKTRTSFSEADPPHRHERC